jgi:hypothetical protein
MSFLDESDFDVTNSSDFNRGGSKPAGGFNFNSGRYGSAAGNFFCIVLYKIEFANEHRAVSAGSRPGTATSISSTRDLEVEDMDDSGLGSAGTLGAGNSNSRARMLAQQREIQQKKRQSTLQSAGIFTSLILCPVLASLHYYRIRNDTKFRRFN